MAQQCSVFENNCHELNFEELKELLTSMPSVRDSVVRQGKIKLKTHAYLRDMTVDEAVRRLLTALDLF